jgi:hypothetical protein
MGARLNLPQTLRFMSTREIKSSQDTILAGDNSQIENVGKTKSRIDIGDRRPKLLLPPRGSKQGGNPSVIDSSSDEVGNSINGEYPIVPTRFSSADPRNPQGPLRLIAIQPQQICEYCIPLIILIQNYPLRRHLRAELVTRRSEPTSDRSTAPSISCPLLCHRLFPL